MLCNIFKPFPYAHDGIHIVDLAAGSGAVSRPLQDAQGPQHVLGPAGLAAALRATARKHKWRRIKEGQEQVGDIGLVLLGEVPATVICRATGWFVGRNDAGFRALPSRAVRIIWAVV